MSDSNNIYGWAVLTRRKFIVIGGLAAAGTVVACSSRPGLPQPSGDAQTDLGGADIGGADADVLVADMAEPITAPVGQSAPTDAFNPALSAPPRVSGYSDGNVVFQRYRHPTGGSTSIWVGAEGKHLRLTSGTAASDGISLWHPRDSEAISDLSRFQRGHLHFEIRTLLGDSVLMAALASSRSA